ncbi:MAG TPA: sirohydrochlorin chelatase [Mycobacteriales bacterium]|nr:sirohydrochlorin chelatase [Mycobacteriales bacterium]
MTTPASLLLVAHGSRDPRAARVVDALVAEVARLRPGVRVGAAYLDHGRPTVDDVLAGADGPVVIVPLLLARGWHERMDLPARLARAPVPVRVTPPLGPHPALAHTLAQRLADAGAPPDPGTAVVVAAVGSRDPRAAVDVRRIAAGLTGWSEVAVATVAAGDGPATVARLRARGRPRVAVAAYVLAPGLLPDRLAEWGADVVTAPLGPAPSVRDVVLARYAAA